MGYWDKIKSWAEKAYFKLFDEYKMWTYLFAAVLFLAFIVVLISVLQISPSIDRIPC